MNASDPSLAAGLCPTRAGLEAAARRGRDLLSLLRRGAAGETVRQEVLALLDDRPTDLSLRDEDGYTPLLRVLGWDVEHHFGTTYHSEALAIAIRLLQKDAPLDDRLPDGTAATDLARRWNDNGYILRVLDCETMRRADPALRRRVSRIDPNWPPPGQAVTTELIADMFRACRQGSADEIAYMLYFYGSQGAANWHHPTWMKGGATPLFAVIDSDSLRPWALRLLLKAGADPNWQDDHGNTALMIAAQKKGVALANVQDLLCAGADLHRVNQDGLTAMDLARAATPDSAENAFAAEVEQWRESRRLSFLKALHHRRSIRTEKPRPPSFPRSKS